MDFLDIEDVGVGVHVLEAVGVQVDELFELFEREIVFLSVVIGGRDLTQQERRAFEEVQEFLEELDALVVFEFFHAVARQIEVLHPVVGELVDNGVLGDDRRDGVLVPHFG